MSTAISAAAAASFGLPLFAKANAQDVPPNIAGAAVSLKSPRKLRRVENKSQLKTAISRARPGDTILLANGEWRDTELIFAAKGTEKAPITLTAETPGSVILSGASHLILKGAYLIVSGLVFRGGGTSSNVIKFGAKNSVTHHCRVTNSVIEDYNLKDAKRSHWVRLNGRFNRVDHNYFAGKTNEGVTVTVSLSQDGSDNNFHSIDHNFFGPRPKLGMNGGETIKVGSGDYLHHFSSTEISRNVFEGCNGESEIISLKSAGNKVRGNLFLRCEGAVTIRQGRQNIVEDNVFLGDGKKDTGGVRITGRDQIIRNNLFIGLRGDDNRSALTLMNGAPGKDQGTYAPVVRALIENNSFFDVSKLTFGARASDSLPQAPVETVFKNNLFMGAGQNAFEIESELGGITFADNAYFGAKTKAMDEGFSSLGGPVNLPSDAMGYRPQGVPDCIGFHLKYNLLTKKDVGPSFAFDD